MVPQRIGSVSGRCPAGEYRVVSLYRDGSSIKLCGPKGSQIVDDMDTALATATDAYGLHDVSLALSRRAA
jgi:hypothetical protein